MLQGALADATMLARLARDFPRWRRRSVTVAAARRAITRRLATRERRFLWLAEHVAYRQPRGPYRQLLAAAGIELGDLRRLVAQEGLEGALGRLVQAGVYVAFDEFKGRAIAVRGSQRYQFADTDFDNPLVQPHVEARSGGSRGSATAVRIGLPYLRDLAASTAVALDAHGLSTARHALWLQGGFGGVLPLLLYTGLGRPPVAWFYPSAPLPWKAHVGAGYLAALGRLVGAPLPVPEYRDLREPLRIATWLAAQAADGPPICLTANASSAVRIAAAARDVGLPLRGVSFITLGEPFTEAKQRIVSEAGAYPLVRYAFTEAGIIGFRCRTPRATDDLHFFRDSFVVVQRPRAVGDTGQTVQALTYTGLLATGPKLLLNVESGDYGRLEQRECGCDLGALGLVEHLDGIRSFEKLSSEGLTFVQTDFLRILEEVLPARFGGQPADYQLVEEEGADGLLRLRLIVAPRVGDVDADAVVGVFLDQLGQAGGFAPLGAGLFRRAGTVTVSRREPIATRAGKILPFHLVGAVSSPKS